MQTITEYSWIVVTMQQLTWLELNAVSMTISYLSFPVGFTFSYAVISTLSVTLWAYSYIIIDVKVAT